MAVNGMRSSRNLRRKAWSTEKETVSKGRKVWRIRKAVKGLYKIFAFIRQRENHSRILSGDKKESNMIVFFFQIH